MSRINGVMIIGVNLAGGAEAMCPASAGFCNIRPALRMRRNYGERQPREIAMKI